MSSKTLWKLCAFFGLSVAIFAVVMLSMFPQTGATDLSGFGGPVFAFEVAQSKADLIAIFGKAGDPQHGARIAKMNEGNLWDFGFMTVYALFMALFFVAVFVRSRRKIWIFLACLGLLAGIMDAAENVMLLQITASLDNPPYLGELAFAVWGKFFAIAAVITGAGVFLLARKKLIWKIGGVIALISALSVPAAFISPAEYGWLMQKGIAAGWIIMSLFAYVRSVDKFGT